MFNNIIGNEKIKKELEESIKNNQVSHSYMFIGEEGIGKKRDSKRICKKYIMSRRK